MGLGLFTRHIQKTIGFRAFPRTMHITEQDRNLKCVPFWFAWYQQFNPQTKKRAKKKKKKKSNPQNKKKHLQNGLPGVGFSEGESVEQEFGGGGGIDRMRVRIWEHLCGLSESGEGDWEWRCVRVERVTMTLSERLMNFPFIKSSL